MSNTFWGHSDRDGKLPEDPEGHWQRLNEHLVQVGALSKKLATLAKPDDAAFAESARVSGLLHDLGKYQPEFQEYLLGNGKSIPHSAHGAAVAYDLKAVLCAFAIAGHHGGLPDPQDGRGSLGNRTTEAKLSVAEIWPVAKADCPELESCGPQPVEGRAGADLRTRMLFSCLVDADRLDSSGEIEYLPRELDRVADRLDALLADLRDKNEGLAEGPVKRARLKVLESCLRAAGEPSRLLSLTVPTGGGKTLASLAFALKRALIHPDRPRRIIVVIPYLSIIEQNAEVLAKILGPETVLEHHSGEFVRLIPNPKSKDSFVPVAGDENAEEPPEYRRGQENWNAPVIVTTAVRFFESLFSNRPSDLRRVHNVARSIVILDEVQTLPCQMLQPLLSVMQDLAENWRTTFLFCTATQPAFEKRTSGEKRDVRWEPNTLTEVMEKPAELFESLRRVEVEWPGPAPSPWAAIAEKMIAERRALCIVNVRDHASKLHSLLGKEGAFHLSTRMCAADRLAVIRVIRERLKDPEAECLVAATQLVEAGVDLDFPVVFRALGPLDSIIQAAGRCDREGELTLALGRPGGRLIVFRTEDGKTPPGIYKDATRMTEDYLTAGRISLHDPGLVREYFHRLYTEGRDLGKTVEEARTKLRFPTVAREFDYIANYTQDVYVPYDDTARRLIARLRAVGFLLPELRKGLQRYTVGLRPNEIAVAGIARVERFKLRNTKTEQEVWICREGYYRPGFGIVLETNASEYVQ